MPDRHPESGPVHNTENRSAGRPRSRRSIATWVLAAYCLGILCGIIAFRSEIFQRYAAKYSSLKKTVLARQSPDVPVSNSGNTRSKFSDATVSGDDRSQEESSEPPGRYRVFLGNKPSGQEQPSGAQAEQISKIMSLGYLPGSKPSPKDDGVLVYEKGLAFDGLNLLTSGHGPEAVLMSMEGEVLHKWRMDFWKVWPDHPLAKGNLESEFWRRVYLFENGDLLAIFEGLGLIKIDKNSNLLWAYPGRCHHDLFLLDDGNIYVLEREIKIIPRISKNNALVEDFVTLLNPEGELLRRISLLEAFEKSQYYPLLQYMGRQGDVFHTNTIEILDGKLQARLPAFKKGNALISLPIMDIIAVLDMDTEKIAWALTGMWNGQHQPTVLDNGNLLLLNNMVEGGVSEVIEFDPLTHEIKWSFRGGPVNTFRTATCGSNQRLPNGNTLISESDNGRAFEVTADKTIVWEYVSLYRAGEHDELIATLFEMFRLPPDFPIDWLNGSES